MRANTGISAPARPVSGAWADVLDAVSALGSTLEPAALLRAVASLLEARTGAPVEVFAVDPERGELRNGAGEAVGALHPGLAAALQLNPGPFALEPGWHPAGPAARALGLRDGDRVAGVAFLAAGGDRDESALPVLAELCGTNLSRALRFDELARLTGDSEHTRNLQQQILDHVSHEFNTPLMILRSSSGFAREASSDEERELFFDMHEQALDRLEELVRGVIEVAHTSARGETRRLTIEDVVSSLVLPHFVDDEWPAGVPALWHRADPVEVEVEPDALDLALEHLLSNARQHAASDGVPVAVAIYGTRGDGPPRPLEAALSALAAGGESLPEPAERPDSLWIEVIDAGRGIPAAEQGMIFEPFTQASNSPLRGVAGAGMGLATASRVIEAAGGRIELDSTLGAGSIFRIQLPAA